MPPRRPDLGAPGPQHRALATPRHILALSGGGFRGLFTARVLELMETERQEQIGPRFDLIAGTSIGGILAIGLACGLNAAHLRAKFQEHGEAIFRWRASGAGGYLRSRYGQGPMKKAIEKILGGKAQDTIANLSIPICVVAIDEETAKPRIFRSNALSPGEGDKIALIDVALATSAAPTFFPPHQIGGRTFVDGGLIANAPDLVAAAEANRRWATQLSDLRILSIGTGGSPRTGKAKGQPGAAGWLVNRRLIEMTIDAQANLAVEQLKAFGVDRFLRIDQTPARPLKLDAASPADAQMLLKLAEAAVAQAKAAHEADWTLFLHHDAAR